MVLTNVELKSPVYMLRSKLYRILTNDWEMVDLNPNSLSLLFLGQETRYFPHVAAMVGCDYSSCYGKSWTSLRRALAGAGGASAFEYFNELQTPARTKCLKGVYGYLH
jgi:hypothetical protein